MKREVSLSALLEDWVADVPDVRVCGICDDPERIEAGQAWVDLQGGRDARLAGARGASVILAPGDARSMEHSIPRVTVPGLDRRLPELAARFWRHPAEQLSVAAIPHNDASAPVAHFLAQSWRRCDNGKRRDPLEGHTGFPNHVAADGINDPFALHERLHGSLQAGADRVVLEVPAVAFEQSWLDDLALEVAVWCGGEKEDSGSRPLFTDCRPRFAVVDHDSVEGKALTRLVAEGVQVLTFGTNGSTELQGSWLGMDAGGMTIRIASPWGGGQVRTGLLGRHNLTALLAAAGTLALMGMPWDRVMHQLEIMSAVPGRLNRIGGEPGQPTAVIDRASTAEELEEVLVALRSHLHGRLNCVIPSSLACDRRSMRVVRSLSDQVFETGPADRARAIRQAFGQGGPHDIVLIVGSTEPGGVVDEELAVRRIMEAAA